LHVHVEIALAGSLAEATSINNTDVVQGIGDDCVLWSKNGLKET
jgi:hypothetical protein